MLNPFRINDWRLSDALKVVVIALTILWVLVGLEWLGIFLPLVRGVVGIGFLLLMPGILALRALRAHRLGSVKTTLFAVGLSIAIVMGTGLFMNVVYPQFGIQQPITLVPVLGTISAVTVALAAACYWRDRDFVDDVRIDWQSLLNPSILFLCLLPFMAIFATYASNVYGSNVGLLGLLVVIAITAYWISASNSVSEERYPFAVFTIALAMLFFASLISSTVWGWDSQKELYSANLVLSSGAWNPALAGATNAVASITVLAPLLSLMSAVSVTWLFKIVYPLIFALTPVAIFFTVRTQTNDKIAFLAAFFVSSLFPFFGELPSLARQEVAELFFVLFLVLMVDKFSSVAEKPRRYVLLAVFASSLVVSHYALAFIYITYIIIAWLLLFLVDNPALSRLRRSADVNLADGRTTPNRTLTLFFVLAVVIFTAVWYSTLGVAATSSIDLVVSQILGSLTPQTVATVVVVGVVAYSGVLALIYAVARRRLQKTGKWAWLLSVTLPVFFVTLSRWEQYDCGAFFFHMFYVGMLSGLHEVGLALYVISILLIVIGLGAIIGLRSARWRFDVEYVALALASLAVLAVATIIPQLAFSVNTTRLFHISTLLLAPFCITGGLFIAQSFVNTISKPRTTDRSALALRILAAFFVVLFLFSSGFVYEVTNQDSKSFVLNSGVDSSVFSDQEVVAGRWLSDVRGNVTSAGPLIPIYADAHRRVLFDQFDLYHPALFFLQPRDTPSNSYIYLGTFNIARDQVAKIAATTLLGGTGISYVDLHHGIAGRNKIFDDGGASIYYDGIR